MSINAINFNPFESGKVSGYTPAAIPSKGAEAGQAKSKNPFAESMGEITEIARAKAEGAAVGLGGTNSPTETLGNRLMIAG